MWQTRFAQRYNTGKRTRKPNERTPDVIPSTHPPQTQSPGVRERALAGEVGVAMTQVPIFYIIDIPKTILHHRSFDYNLKLNVFF